MKNAPRRFQGGRQWKDQNPLSMTRRLGAWPMKWSGLRRGISHAARPEVETMRMQGRNVSARRHDGSAEIFCLPPDRSPAWPAHRRWRRRPTTKRLQVPSILTCPRIRPRSRAAPSPPTAAMARARNSKPKCAGVFHRERIHVVEHDAARQDARQSNGVRTCTSSGITAASRRSIRPSTRCSFTAWWTRRRNSRWRI